MNDHEAKIEAIARCYEELAIGYHQIQLAIGYRQIPGTGLSRRKLHALGMKLHEEVRRLAAQHNMSSAQVDAGERRARRRLAKEYNIDIDAEI